MNESRLKFFPISFFAMILGLSGYSIALQKNEEVLHLSFHISTYFMLVTFDLATVLGIFYAAKSIKYFHEVKIDFSHPVRMNFYTHNIYYLFIGFYSNP